VEPHSTFNDFETSYENRAMRIVEIAFMALLDDAKQLVADGVRKDVALLISQAESEEQRHAATIRGAERERFLKEWLRFNRPLAYGESRSRETTYQSLVQAVVASSEDVSYGLPNLQDHAMTRTAFVESLIKMSSPVAPSTPAAPVLKNGSFLPLLMEAHRNLLALSPHKDNTAQQSFVQEFFLRAVRHLRICFVPSHRPRLNVPGAPHRKPIFDSWAHLGLRDDSSLRSLPPPSHNIPSSSQHAANIALANALANDSDADWLVNNIHINALHTVLHKTCLPKDFATPSQSGVSYVDETYAWVRQAYDGKRPIHHLALIVGVIASSFIPDLFPPKDIPKSLFKDAKTEDTVHAIWNNLSWESRGYKKGMSDRSIFIAMFTTFIIALYEPSSPLRQYMGSATKMGLGEPWTNKHSKFSFYLLLAIFSYTFSPSSC